MDINEFLNYIDSLAQVAASSDDETVRKLAGCLMVMKGSILAGGPFLESFIDQMSAMNRNLGDTLRSHIRK
jgi:hypothetical protein